MTQRGWMAVRWAMRLVGAVLIAFVILTGVYGQFAAPTMGEGGVAMTQGDTADRYLVADTFATDCVFTGKDGGEVRLGTQPLGRSFLKGTTFSPPGVAGTLTCDRELRVMSGGAAKLAQVAEHEFLVAFPGVLLIAIAQVVGPRRERKTRRS
ncbi:hypothetical protein [Haloechinothrix salitolerans]|uniref:Uncharacterized protein n=2 Tax=Haloechinothrix salitolerans TaxID=926830 RepID=A0ABW2BRA8_9PSEU